MQDLFANRYALGLTVADARTIAKELFSIADERDEAINRTGKYASDAVFAPKALRWLDEQEEELLGGLGKDTNETGYDTWYNGENFPSGTDDDTESSPEADSNGYIQVPGQSTIGVNSNNPAVNCYGYVLMYLGIQPSDGNYDIQPGQLSENTAGDHAHVVVFGELRNKDLETITDYMVRDFEKSGKDVRFIDSYEDAKSNETVIALKNKDAALFPDYHCAVLLDDGLWADKQGTGNASRLGKIKDPDKAWGEWWNRYNSETVYFAISEN